MNRIVLKQAMALVILCACGETEPSDIAPDAGGVSDAAQAADANQACPDPTVALPTEWRPILQVASGVVEDLGDGSYYVDGAAGGTPNAPDNPFIYLRFGSDGLEKVDITDIDARSDARWDLAVKRMVLLSNGGDSGLAGHSIARIAATDIGEAGEVPSNAMFATDQWADEDCDYIGGLIGEPSTAVGTWYDYDTSTSQLSPMDSVYVLRRQDGSEFLFEIETYYYEDFGSAHYAMKFLEL